MRFVNPIVFVSDISVSRSFHVDVVGLTVEQDRGDFVPFRAISGYIPAQP